MNRTEEAVNVSSGEDLRHYVEHTGQDIGTIEEAMERDRFLAPEDAKEFGPIEEVVTSRPAPQAEAASGG